MKSSLFLVVLFINLAFQVLSAAEQTAQIKLSNYLNHLESYSAFFQQQVVASNGHLMDTSSGQFIMKRPNQFRWQIFKPYEQIILSDGKTIWSVDIDLEQITISQADTSIANTPILLLSRENSELSDQFDVTLYNDTQGASEPAVHNDENIERFLLKPKDQSANFEHIQLGFKAGILNLIELYDSLGQITIIKMSNIRRNPTLGNHYFHFEMIDDYKNFDIIDTSLQHLENE